MAGDPSTSKNSRAFAGLRPVALSKLALPAARWVERRCRRTQLRPLWALGTRTGREGPRDLGEPCQHLCLHVLSSSACFVDTWPRLSRHLLLFLLCGQPFPRLPRWPRGRSTAACTGPASAQEPGTAVQSTGSSAFRAPRLSFLTCQRAEITGASSQGEGRRALEAWHRAWHTGALFPARFHRPGPFRAGRPFVRGPVPGPSQSADLEARLPELRSSAAAHLRGSWGGRLIFRVPRFPF